jgi:hypothetical protein
VHASAAITKRSRDFIFVVVGVLYCAKVLAFLMLVCGCR